MRKGKRGEAPQTLPEMARQTTVPAATVQLLLRAITAALPASEIITTIMPTILQRPYFQNLQQIGHVPGFAKSDFA